MRSVVLPVLFVVLFPLSVASRAQSVSQDYARYSAMLNQERADAAQRDQQALYDRVSTECPKLNQRKQQ